LAAGAGPVRVWAYHPFVGCREIPEAVGVNSAQGLGRSSLSVGHWTLFVEPPPKAISNIQRRILNVGCKNQLTSSPQFPKFHQRSPGGSFQITLSLLHGGSYVGVSLLFRCVLFFLSFFSNTSSG
jgi:hypothetical protein